jgi:hypothetical protein
MPSPPSQLWWCQLSSVFAGPETFLGLGSSVSGLPEITTVQNSSANWQFVPSEAIYYIRNEAAGPHFQLGLSSNPLTASHEPNLVTTSLSSSEQQWALEIDADGARIQNVALGDLGFLNVSRDGLKPSFGESGNSGEIWNIKPVKMIHDASFLTSAQVCFPSEVTTRQCPFLKLIIPRDLVDAVGQERPKCYFAIGVGPSHCTLVSIQFFLHLPSNTILQIARSCYY